MNSADYAIARCLSVRQKNASVGGGSAPDTDALNRHPSHIGSPGVLTLTVPRPGVLTLTL